MSSTDPSRAATAEIIARFAATGRDDPAIAARLGITAVQVRELRKEFGIKPGETRWFVRRRALSVRHDTAGAPGIVLGDCPDDRAWSAGREGS